MQQLTSFSRLLESATSLAELDDQVGRGLAALGFHAFTLGIAPLFRGKLDSSRAVLRSTLPTPFQEAYRSGAMEAFDPIFELMATRYQPFTRSSIEAMFGQAPATQRISDLADGHAIGEAWMVPATTADTVRGVVLFTRESPGAFELRLADQAPLLLHAGLAIMARAEALGFAPAPPTSPEQVGLSDREAQCLQWCAQGKTNDEIAFALGITERTVRFHLANACTKLGTDRRSLAITRAVQFGLVRT